MILKILVTLYAICLIPTIIAIFNWPNEQREAMESKVGSLCFFLSAWIASPFILIQMLLHKFQKQL